MFEAGQAGVSPPTISNKPYFRSVSEKWIKINKSRDNSEPNQRMNVWLTGTVITSHTSYGWLSLTKVINSSTIEVLVLIIIRTSESVSIFPFHWYTEITEGMILTQAESRLSTSFLFKHIINVLNKWHLYSNKHINTERSVAPLECSVRSRMLSKSLTNSLLTLFSILISNSLYLYSKFDVFLLITMRS